MTGKNTTRISLNELKTMKGQTRPDAPEGDELGDDFWEKAELVMPEKKRSVHLRVDPDVYEFFKGQGKGHLTRMNAVLRSYVDAQKAR